jgi:hypothetical protein
MVYLFAGAFSGALEGAKPLLFTDFVWKKPLFCGIIFLLIKSEYFTERYTIL